MAKKEAQAALKQLKAMGYEEVQAQEMVQQAQAKGFKVAGFLKLFRKLFEMFISGEISTDDFFEQTGGTGLPAPARGEEEEEEEEDEPAAKATRSGGASGYRVRKGAKKL